MVLHILNLDTGWSEWSLLFSGKSPRYVLVETLDGRQSRSGRCREEKNMLPLLGIEPQSLMTFQSDTIDK